MNGADLPAGSDLVPAGHDLRDPVVRRHRAADALLGSADPVLREIGEQIRDGRMRPADAIRVPAYAEALRHAARHAAEFVVRRREGR